MPKVKFLPSGIEIEAKIGESLLDIALEHNIPIQHACGGFCACTTCRCEIIDGISRVNIPEEDELERLNVMEDRTENSRLACQSKICGDLVVRVVNSD